MNTKALGFTVGAVLAGIAVFAFNTWHHVSDDDRLQTVLADHCLPFVIQGLEPFGGMGRPIGVYDQADLSENIRDGGAAILYDNRFVAQWGISEDQNSAVRVCLVNDSFARADSVGFVVDVAGLPRWIEGLAPQGTPLVASQETVLVGPTISGWYEPDARPENGLRIVLGTAGGGVSSVLVATDIDG